MWAGHMYHMLCGQAMCIKYHVLHVYHMLCGQAMCTFFESFGRVGGEVFQRPRAVRLDFRVI